MGWDAIRPLPTRSPTPIETMRDFLFGFVAGSGLLWVAMSHRRDVYWREFNTRRRGSNPPPPGRKPAPPAGPPEQPLTAQLIRYWYWKNEQVRRAWTDPGLGDPWPEGCQPAPAPPTGPPCGGGEITLAQWEAMRTPFVEGRTQRGNGNGGPTTPKPPIKPQPHGGRLIKSWEEPSPPSEP